MSVLDLMTDEDLRQLVQYKNDEIARLQGLVKYYSEDRDRLYKFSQAKAKRIAELVGRIAELEAKQ